MGLLLAATGVGAAGGGASAATPGQTITVKVPAGSAGGHASYEVPVTGDQHRQRVEGVSTITIHNPAQMDATITDVSGAMGQANDVVSDLPALPYTLKAGQTW